MIIRHLEKDYELAIDVLEELSIFEWNRARVKTSEMVACSPFRDESSPSFSINLDTGLWIDFGSSDTFNRGNIVTLLSFLRNETPLEIERYLIQKYGIDLTDVDSLSLNFDLNSTVNNTINSTIISINEYKQYAYRHEYLYGRGISEKVQRAFKIGYDKKGNAVAFPWQNKQGEIINVKFRSVRSKQFYYLPHGQPIRNYLYGMHFIFKLNSKVVYLVESEIDALYLWSNGFAAIALGGSNISEAQRQLILNSPIEKLVIATDNDNVGREIKSKLVQALIGYKDLYEITMPDTIKDINDIPVTMLDNICNNVQLIPINII